MKQQSIVFGILGLLIGGLLTGIIMVNRESTNAQPSTQKSISASPTQTNAEDSMENMDHSQLSMYQMSMGDMMIALQGRTGDDFDRIFIQSMIGHHQGAIDMAKQAKQNAKHEEIKKLADDIIMAQEKEITEMMRWGKEWGYTQ